MALEDIVAVSGESLNVSFMNRGNTGVLVDQLDRDGVVRHYIILPSGNYVRQNIFYGQQGIEYTGTLHTQRSQSFIGI